MIQTRCGSLEARQLIYNWPQISFLVEKEISPRIYHSFNTALNKEKVASKPVHLFTLCIYLLTLNEPQTTVFYVKWKILNALQQKSAKKILWCKLNGLVLKHPRCLTIEAKMMSQSYRKNRDWKRARERENRAWNTLEYVLVPKSARDKI